ncbi:lectin-like [Silurus meridionalis]|nr:lectin-like [Silurus meridionalis]
MSRNFLSMNEELLNGDFLMSNNREYKAIFQDDGNFVVYTWRPVWASNTCDTGAQSRLVMQTDCNLVMYDQESEVVWATNTNRNDAKVCRLTLTNDGFLQVDNNAAVVWMSTKSN